MNKSLLLWICCTLLFIGSCKKDKDFKNGDACLEFTADTVLFDTVFTKLDPNTSPKSINKQFIIRNPYNEDVKTNVFLAGGNNSQFRLNVDGEPGTAFPDVLIRAKDSIYVFVELYALPNGGTNKLIITDSIRIQTNNCLQHVQLRAWGQDARFFNDSTLDCDITWADISKPYVIYNHVLVPAGCTLTIKPGVHIYNAPGSYFYVAGTLKVEGSPSNRVIFEGDRLEASYANEPGQWGGIHILRDSKDNTISYALIKNAYIGITVDSLPSSSNPNLSIDHTIIQTATAIGLYGKTATIRARNCAFTNCGQLTFYGRYGGNYDFINCTFSSFNNFLPRDKPLFAIVNRERDQFGNIIGLPFPVTFKIRNCIIYGSNKEELFFDIDGTKYTAPPVVGTNIFRTDIGEFVGIPNIYRVDPKFKKHPDLDFSLDTLSPAVNKGDGSLGITDDILGKPRTGAPDLGAYERID